MKKLLLYMMFSTLLSLGVCAAETVIYENDFSDPATLSDFKQYCLDWEISDGGLRLTEDTEIWSHIIYQADEPLTEYIVEVDYMNVQTAGGIVFNVQQDKVDEQQYGFYGQTALLSNDATRGFLGCTTDTGAWKGNINVGKTASDMSANVHIKVTIKDGKIRVHMTDIDSKKTVYYYTYSIGTSANDQGFTNGTVGLRMRSNNAATMANSVGMAYFDNFKITAAALETTDYGYYDYDTDGDTEITDVLLMLRALVNATDPNVSLLRTIRTLHASTDSTATTGTVQALANGVFTVKKADKSTVTLTPNVLGIPAGDDLASYVGYPIALSVSETDGARVYAAKLDRAFNRVLFAEAGNPNATVNGKALPLPAAPFVRDGALFVPIELLREAEIVCTDISAGYSFAKNGVSVSLTETTTPALIVQDETVFAPFAYLAEQFGDGVTAAEDALTVIAYAQAFLYAEAVTAKAGETVEIPLLVRNAAGITGMQFLARLDTSVLTYSGVSGGNSGMYLSASDQGANPVKIVLANLNLKEKFGSFTAAKLSFAIDANAAKGTYTVPLEDMQAYDSDVLPLYVSCQSILITIE